MRVVLIGQAAFAEAVYRRLLEQNEEIVGVFYEREGDPLHTLAQEQGVPAYPTSELRSREFFQTYGALGADLNVMAFVTAIIPERVINLPSHGTIQYHPSLLPLHRGRTAINWAIINGETETGITIFWPDRGIDTGPVLLQKKAPISPTDTVGSLYRNYLFPQGVEGLGEAIALVNQGRAPKIVQDEAQATYEPPCEGEVASIRWFHPAEQVYNHIRGCDPQPGAATTLRQELIRLTDAELGPRTGPGMYGEVVAIEETGIRVALNGGTLLVRRIRREGERPIPAAEFAHVVGLEVGERLTG
ncbi:MAG: methionyl-tRNA formyltransferase [Chloroflexota bacterium]